MRNIIVGSWLIVLGFQGFAAEERKEFHEHDATAGGGAGAASGVYAGSSASSPERAIAVDHFIANLLQKLNADPSKRIDTFKDMVGYLFAQNLAIVPNETLAERTHEVFSLIDVHSERLEFDIHSSNNAKKNPYKRVLRIISSIGNFSEEEYKNCIENLRSIIEKFKPKDQLKMAFSKPCDWMDFCIEVLPYCKSQSVLKKLDDQLKYLNLSSSRSHDLNSFIATIIKYTEEDPAKIDQILEFVISKEMPKDLSSLRLSFIGLFNTTVESFDALLTKVNKERRGMNLGYNLAFLGGIPVDEIDDFYQKIEAIGFPPSFSKLLPSDKKIILEELHSLQSSGGLNKDNIDLLGYLSSLLQYREAFDILARLRRIIPKDLLGRSDNKISEKIYSWIDLIITFRSPEDRRLILQALEEFPKKSKISGTSWEYILDAVLSVKDYKKFLREASILEKVKAKENKKLPDMYKVLSEIACDDISSLKILLKNPLTILQFVRMTKFGAKHASFMSVLEEFDDIAYILPRGRADPDLLNRLMRSMLFTRRDSAEGIIENIQRISRIPSDRPMTRAALYMEDMEGIVPGENVYSGRMNVHQDSRDKKTRRAFDLLLDHQKFVRIDTTALIDELKAFVRANDTTPDQKAIKALMAGLDGVPEVSGYFKSLLSGEEGGLYDENHNSVHTDETLLAHLWYYIAHLDAKDQGNAKAGLMAALRECVAEESLICNPGKYQHLALSVLQGQLEGVQIDSHSGVGVGAGAGGGRPEDDVREFIKEFDQINHYFLTFTNTWIPKIKTPNLKALDVLADAFDYWLNLFDNGLYIDPRNLVFYLIFGEGSTGVTDLSSIGGLVGMMQAYLGVSFGLFEVESYINIFNEQEKAIALQVREQKEKEAADRRKIEEDRKLRNEQDRAYKAGRKIDEERELAAEKAKKAAEEEAARKAEVMPADPAARRALMLAAAERRATEANSGGVAPAGGAGAGAGSL